MRQLQIETISAGQIRRYGPTEHHYRITAELVEPTEAWQRYWSPNRQFITALLSGLCSEKVYDPEQEVYDSETKTYKKIEVPWYATKIVSYRVEQKGAEGTPHIVNVKTRREYLD